MQAANNNNNGCVQNGATANGAAENGHGEGSEMGTAAITLSETNQDIVRLIGQYLKNEGLK